MNITHFHGTIPGDEKHVNSYDRGPVLKSYHNLRAARAFTMSLRTLYLWNGTTKKR
jgi:hypothetical protein